MGSLYNTIEEESVLWRNLRGNWREKVAFFHLITVLSIFCMDSCGDLNVAGIWRQSNCLIYSPLNSMSRSIPLTDHNFSELSVHNAQYTKLAPKRQKNQMRSKRRQTPSRQQLANPQPDSSHRRTIWPSMWDLTAYRSQMLFCSTQTQKYVQIS